ncbi:Response regulator receiver domain-containing protein [Gillisia sp. Hel1_33_143]|uniref:response regulator n=1 Tax=unclassified Gillisia TaxID=2615025 RepID=UPI00055617FE|nr:MULTISPECIES: response regulator [unclassified Gillisia]SDS83819.1 Response regulator receiver domain-containing protein [Gillisia sp. Hel1_33_143]
MKKIDIACIIDDDPIFVFSAKKIMQIADFCNGFLVFHNGHEAISNLKAIISNKEQNMPDVILLDLNMPVMDGWEFLDEFVKIPSNKEITIYIVTSSVDPYDVIKAKAYDHVSNYIVKPISMESLKELMISESQQKVN